MEQGQSVKLHVYDITMVSVLIYKQIFSGYGEIICSYDFGQTVGRNMVHFYENIGSFLLTLGILVLLYLEKSIFGEAKFKKEFPYVQNEISGLHYMIRVEHHLESLPKQSSMLSRSILNLTCVVWVSRIFHWMYSKNFLTKPNLATPLTLTNF